MNKDSQNEIYEKWKQLEVELNFRVQEVVPGQKIEVQFLDLNKLQELNKYRKWVNTYCQELLDPAEKFEVQKYGIVNCKCEDKDCAKCLLVNCKDDDCYFHPKEYKDDFKRRYNAR